MADGDNNDTNNLSVGGGSGFGSLLKLDGQASFLVVTLAVVILTLGGVAALLMFIWLSFQYPDRANTLIPLVIAPLGTLVIAHGGKLKQAIGARGKTPPSVGEAGASSGSPEKLAIPENAPSDGGNK